MPVYLRKNMSFTPSSLADPADGEGDDMEDYIQDPEQVRDRLPQPFRMIDKVVNTLVENAWDILYRREDEKMRDATKVRAPQYECSIEMKDHCNACCIAGTEDGKYVVIGQTDGLAVIDARTQDTVAAWKDEKLEVTSLQLSSLDEKMYMISTIDDMGVCRLFAYCEEQIFLLSRLNEQEGDKKLVASKCEPSRCSDYVGICLESVSSQESWLEIHKTPKETWLKELNTASSKDHSRRDVTQAAKATSPVHGDEPSAEYMPPPESVAVESPSPSVAENTDADHDHQSISQKSGQSLASPREGKSSHKFSSTSLVLRVRPQPPVTGIHYNTAQQLAKTVDSTGDILGTGTNHLISNQHLELRKAMFEQLHQHLLQYKPSDNNNNNQPLRVASFHFLTAGRMLPQGLDSTSLTPSGVPTTVCVWWSGQTQFLHYSLVKTAKDVERKPDIVWPMSSEIVTSTTTPCTSLLAVALSNNNLVVWDKCAGTPRRVLHIAAGGPITSLHFLDPAVTPQTETAYPPYRLHTQSQLMVVCRTGQVFLVGCGFNDLSEPQPLNLNVEKDSERPTLVACMTGIPQLIITARDNGKVFLQDLMDGGRQLCQVTLPKSHDLTSPWQPIVTVGAQGQMLYMKGTLNEEEVEANAVATEDAENEDKESVTTTGSQTALFVFQLRSFPSLDKYRSEDQKAAVPYVVHTKIEERAEALLKHRISQQGLRQSYLQSRWSLLKDDLGKQRSPHRKEVCPVH